MTPERVQLALFAVLGVLCLWGWRAEAARARASQVLAPGTLPPSVRRLRVVGDGEWIVLGVSEEGDHVSAAPTLVARSFELRDDAGNVVPVAAGTAVEIRALDGARRAPVDGITSGGVVKVRYTFEVRPDTAVFSRATGVGSAMTPYRSESPEKVSEEPLVLAGNAEAVAVSSSTFPGCWLLILFPFVGGGIYCTYTGATILSWVSLGIAVVLVAVAAMALPEKYKVTPPPT